MNKTKPSARVLLDSISPMGHRVTTLEVVMHRFILAEFNTHRAFSRNSASSRAVPVTKTLARVLTDPAIPLEWPTERKGMSGGEPLRNEPGPGNARLSTARAHWLYAAEVACNHAEQLVKLGVHKSVVNRLLEPFSWHTVIVTATDWEGFFDQRLACDETGRPLAQPEMYEVAHEMYRAIALSKPTALDYDEWHTPLITDHEDDRDLPLDARKRISAARCARVSYLTHDGRRDHLKDMELYDRLVRDGHWSPLEHVCTPASLFEIDRHMVRGNLTRWRQLRHIAEGQRR